MKRTILTFVLAVAALVAMGQEKVLGNDSTAQEEKVDSAQAKVRCLQVHAEVRDHLTHDAIKGLKGANLWAADSSFVDSIHGDYFSGEDYKRSDVTINITQPGKYLVKVEAEGYQPAFVPLDIKRLYKRELHRVMKTIYLKRIPKRNDIELGEVVVKATKLKFYMNGDTLVYDADAFNLAEGSMLDGLLKKLPGVTLERGGVIKVNGKSIDTMLLNGKDFFNRDRELLLENMPAYMVKHVVSYERVPEEVRGKPGEKTARKELVMDVRLKKEYSRGWIANAEGGGGLTFFKNDKGHHDAKFLGRLFGMRFDDQSRLVLFAKANNLNDYSTPGNQGEWSPLEQSEGLETSYKVGGNYMRSQENRYQYEGSVETTYSDNDNRQNGSSTTFLEGGNSYGRSFNASRSYEWELETQHDLTLEHEEPLGDFIKGLYLYIRPHLIYRKWNNHSDGADVTLSDDVAEQLGKAWMDSIMAPQAGELLRRYAINRTRSNNKEWGHRTTTDTQGRLSFEPAHNDFITFAFDFNQTFYDYQQKVYNHYLLDYPNSTTMPADFRNRHEPLKQRGQGYRIGSDAYFYLDKQHLTQLRVGYDFEYHDEKNNNSLYLLNKLEGWEKADNHPLGTLPSIDEMLSTLDANNSSEQAITRIIHLPCISFDKILWTEDEERDWYASLYGGVSFPMVHERMNYRRGAQVDTLMIRNTAFFHLDLHCYYSMGKRGRSIHFRYELQNSAPSMTSLLNIRDDSNPLYITLGNPNLKNTHRHNFSGQYRDKFGKTLFNASTRVMLTQNAVASGFIYNKETGVRTVTPDNVDGNWNMDMNSGIDFPLTKNDKWRVKENAGYRYNHSVDLSGTNESMVASRSVVGTHNVTDELSLNCRPSDKVEFGVSGKLDYQHSTSDREYFTNINAFTYQYGVTGQIELPWNMQVGTDLTMYSRRGYSEASMNTNELVWNAHVAKRLMHGNLTVMFDGFDLLGNLSNVRRYINAQGRSETFVNVIPSYGLLHIIWRLNKQPKKNDNTE